MATCTDCCHFVYAGESGDHGHCEKGHNGGYVYRGGDREWTCTYWYFRCRECGDRATHAWQCKEYYCTDCAIGLGGADSYIFPL